MSTSSSFYSRRKNSKLISILIVILLVSTLYAAQSIALIVNTHSGKNIDEDNPNYNQFIVKFNDVPLVTFKNNLKDKMGNLFTHLPKNVASELLTQWVLQYKNKILSRHMEAKESISKLAGKTTGSLFLREFTILFNGIVIKNISQSAIKKIENLSCVKSVDRDSRLAISLKDSVSIINADEASLLYDKHGSSIAGTGVTIAILDTGVDYNHPDLKDGFIGGYDFVNDDADPIDDNGHGTHCAGIAAGNGNASNFTFVGVAPKAKFYAYKVMDSNGTGYMSWFIEAMERAVDPNGDDNFTDHADIISISAGDSSGNPNDAFSMAANNAVDLGVIVVAAAGNDGPAYDTISSPGCAQNVICVGATDKNDNIASFSSRGSNSSATVKPNVLAPGVDITSTWYNGEYISLSGTSMACPHVTGTVALILQMHPDWSPDKIKMALEKSAVDLKYDIATQGHGRIDALKAITSFGSPISKLEICSETNHELINICGTALANNFQNYSLYYQIVNETTQNIGWIKLCECYVEVNNNVLFTWGTHSLPSGNYSLKLEVKSRNQTSVDIAFVSLKQGNDTERLFIYAPNEITESEQFTVSLRDVDGVSQRALFLLTFPHALPKVKFGTSPIFKAPLLLNQRIQSVKGRLIVFCLYERFNVKNKDITLYNAK